eukprot:scaffold52507_cov24-Phaeocystis_antarctica.AAC.1
MAGGVPCSRYMSCLGGMGDWTSHQIATTARSRRTRSRLPGRVDPNLDAGGRPEEALEEIMTVRADLTPSASGCQLALLSLRSMAVDDG